MDGQKRRRGRLATGRQNTIHSRQIEESASLTKEHFNCCGFNKWKIVKNYKQTITSRSDASSSPKDNRGAMFLIREFYFYFNHNHESGVKTTAPEAVASL